MLDALVGSLGFFTVGADGIVGRGCIRSTACISFSNPLRWMAASTLSRHFLDRTSGHLASDWVLISMASAMAVLEPNTLMATDFVMGFVKSIVGLTSSCR